MGDRKVKILHPSVLCFLGAASLHPIVYAFIPPSPYPCIPLTSSCLHLSILASLLLTSPVAFSRLPTVVP